MKNKHTRDILLVVLISLIYFLPGIISPRDFWVEDEARYGEVLREMVHDGQWWVTHLNGTYYPDKPPTYFWLCALVAKGVGKITPAGCLVITWLSTVGTLILTFLIALRLFNRKTAWLSTLSLMSTFLFLGCAQIIRMDMQLTLFSTWAMYLFYMGFYQGSKKVLPLFYLMAGLAVLSKGPLGFFFPFLGVVVFLLVQRNWDWLKSLLLNWGWLFVLLLVGGWLGGAILMGHLEFLKIIFSEQIAGRAVKSFIHKEPFYFYAMLLPAMLLPWTSYVIRGVRWMFNENRTLAWYLVCWFLAGFLLISFISGKLFIYVLPLLPPVSIFIGAFFAKLFDKENLPGKGFVTESIFMVLFTFGLFASVPFFAKSLPSTQLSSFWPFTYIFVPLLVLGFYFALKKMVQPMFYLLFAGMWLFSAYTFIVLVPQADPIMSGRQIGYDIRHFIDQGYHVGQYHVQRGLFNFYAESTFEEIPADSSVFHFFEEPKRLLIMQKRHFHRHGDKLGENLKMYSWYEIANMTYALIYQEEKTE